MSLREFITSFIWTAASMLIYVTMLNYFYVPESILPHISQSVSRQDQSCIFYDSHIIYTAQDYTYIAPNGNLKNQADCQNLDLWSVMQFKHDPSLKVTVNYESHKDFTLTCNVEVTNLNYDATSPELCTLDLTLINSTKDSAAHGIVSKNGQLEISKNSKVYNLDEVLQDTTESLTVEGWVGVVQDHWAHIIKPQHQAEYQSIDLIDKGYSGKLNGYQIRSKLFLEYNKPQTITFVMFCGPKILQLLKSINSDFTKIDWIIDYGYFTFIIRPVFELLSLISDYLLDSNLAYGVILLTVFSKIFCILCFPLTLLQPEKEKIKNGLIAAFISLVTALIIYKLVYTATEFRYTSLWWINNVSAVDSSSLIDYIKPGISSMIGFKLSITTLLVAIATSMQEMIFARSERGASIAILFLVVVMMAFIPAIFGILYVANTMITIVEKLYIHPK